MGSIFWGGAQLKLIGPEFPARGPVSLTNWVLRAHKTRMRGNFSRALSGTKVRRTPQFISGTAAENPEKKSPIA